MFQRLEHGHLMGGVRGDEGDQREHYSAYYTVNKIIHDNFPQPEDLSLEVKTTPYFPAQCSKF